MSDKKKFKDTAVGRFIHEKVKPVAGDVLEFVGDVTGIEAIDKVGEFINKKADEDAQFRALQIELEEKRAQWELEFRKIELEELKAELADTQSARSREVEYMKSSGGKRDWLMGSAVIVALVMYVGGFAFLAYGPTVPQEKKDLFNMGVGQVFTFAGMVFSYYLGTTRSSRQKDDIIKNVVR